MSIHGDLKHSEFPLLKASDIEMKNEAY